MLIQKVGGDKSDQWSNEQPWEDSGGHAGRGAEYQARQKDLGGMDGNSDTCRMN